MRGLILAGAAALALLAGPAGAADSFYSGSRAYTIGVFGSAARHWMELADRGHGPAQYNIGRMIYYGQGFPRDAIEAYKWFLLAMDSGVERSRVAARMVGEKLSSRQIAEATVRAREWRQARTRRY